MDQRTIAFIVIGIGVLLAATVFVAKAKEDALVSGIIAEKGSCYLADGTCLHEDRDYSVYIAGWVLSASLIILGIYLLLSDHTHKMLAHTSRQVSSALKEARSKDEWNAFLSGFSYDEQLVIKAVHAQDGIKQSTLRYKTGLSKTGLSLMLKDLEKRGVVTRTSAGKSNLVYIRRKF